MLFYVEEYRYPGRGASLKEAECKSSDDSGEELLSTTFVARLDDGTIVIRSFSLCTPRGTNVGGW